MYSNERGRGRQYYRPSSMPTEDTLHRLQMESEGKAITVALQANWRGFFIQVTVEENGWRGSVIVPLSVAAEFRERLENVTNEGLTSKGMIETEGKAGRWKMMQWRADYLDEATAVNTALNS